MNEMLTNVIFNLIAAIIFYLAGLASSRFWHVLFKHKNEKIFKESVHKALQIIKEAEEKFPGSKRGEEKLEFAVKKFMDETKYKDYEKAQNYIIQIFNLTKLSKEDLPTKYN